MTKNIIIGVLAVVVLVFGVNYFSSGSLLSAAGPGYTHYQTENFLFGLFAGTTGQLQVTGAGVVSSTAVARFGGLTVGTGTAYTAYNCTTTSWNPAAVTATTTATTSVAVASFSAGDTFSVSLNTSTLGLHLEADSGTSTVVVTLSQPGGAAASADVATSTLKVCYTH